jgi:hypothetical protein
MPKVSMTFRFVGTDVNTWKAAAEQAGMTLTEWISRRCNGGSHVEENRSVVGVAPVAEAKEQRDNRADTPVNRASPVEARQVVSKPKSKKLELAEAVAARNPGHKVGCQCFQCVQIERFIRQQRKE